MKLYCSIFLILVVNSYVLCELEGIDLYRKERRDFRQEVDRLFNDYYLRKDLIRSSDSQELNDGASKIHPRVVESKPLSAPDWSADTYGTRDQSFYDLSSEYEDDSSGDIDITTSPRLMKPQVVFKVTSDKDGTEIEGSGIHTDDEDDDEDLGSGMEEDRLEFTPSGILPYKINKLLLNPEYVKCGMSLKDEAYSCIGLALNVRTFLNEIQIITQIVLQMKPRHLNPNYSFFMPIFKMCALHIGPSSSCENYQNEKKEFVKKMSDKMIDFASRKDRHLVEAPTGNGDLKCLGANLIHIEKCVYSAISNGQVDHVLRVVLLHTTNWTVGDCKDFRVVKDCIVNSLSRCDDEIANQLISIVTKADVITTCQTQELTTEPSGRPLVNSEKVPINHANIGVPLGTLLTLTISVLASRL